MALLCAAGMAAQEVALSDSINPASAERIIVQQQHFGYISYDNALKAMHEYEVAMLRLTEMKKACDEEMVRSEQEFSHKFAEYIDGQKEFPDNIMLKRQKELQLLLEESIRFKDESKALLQKSEDELMAPLHDRLRKVLAEVGLRRNLAYILNTDNNAYPFVNTTGEAEDVTAEVIEMLNR